MAYCGERDRLEGRIAGKDLQRALWTEPPTTRLMPGVPRKMDHNQRIRLKTDCDEVFPGIINSNGDTIKDIGYLLDLGVTHVLNTAEADVRIDPTKFAKNGICYKGFLCKDMPHANITQFFEECANFLERALSMRCGLVVVNCLMGYSRCSTIVAAYLMLKKNYTATQVYWVVWVLGLTRYLFCCVSQTFALGSLKNNNIKAQWITRLKCKFYNFYIFVTRFH